MPSPQRGKVSPAQDSRDSASPCRRPPARASPIGRGTPCRQPEEPHRRALGAASLQRLREAGRASPSSSSRRAAVEAAPRPAPRRRLRGRRSPRGRSSRGRGHSREQHSRSTRGARPCGQECSTRARITLAGGAVLFRLRRSKRGACVDDHGTSSRGARGGIAAMTFKRYNRFAQRRRPPRRRVAVGGGDDAGVVSSSRCRRRLSGVLQPPGALPAAAAAARLSREEEVPPRAARACPGACVRAV